MSNTQAINTGTTNPAVTTTFITDDGTATTPANILIVHVTDTTDDNPEGIAGSGGVAGTGTQNEVDIKLTNRIRGTGTTTDGSTPVTLYSFDAGATPGTYLLYTRIVVFNETTGLSASYASFRCVRTDGATCTLIGATTTFLVEEGAMSALDLQNTVSGNNIELVATGYNTDTLNYLALTEFQFVS